MTLFDEPEIDLSEWLTEPEDVYHAKAQDYFSSGQLRDFLKSPQLLRRKQLGLIAEPDRPHYLIGRAAHCLILEGRQAYEERYLVSDGPINVKTGRPYGAATQAYKAWAEGQPVISTADAVTIEAMAQAVDHHAEARRLLSAGRPELVYRSEVEGVPCQIRADWLNPSVGIVDLKTTRDIDKFADSFREYGYQAQLDFYRLVAGLTDTAAHVIAVEKQEPFRCGVFVVRYRYDLRDMIAVYRECMETNLWPTGYEETREI